MSFLLLKKGKLCWKLNL